MKSVVYNELKVDQMSRIPQNVFDSLKIHMANLEAALLARDPQMPNHLRESHRLLITYPETTHLLDDDEINQLITAAEDHVKVKIVQDVAKGKGSRGKSLSKLGKDDL